MNILVVAAQGLYGNYSASFVHNQIKEYVKAGHAVRAVIPVAIGKKTDEFARLSSPVVAVVHDGVEILYVRCLSLSAWGEHTFNPMAAEKAVSLWLGRILRDFRPDIIHAHGILFGGRIGVLLKKRCGVPLVITTHGGDTRLSVTDAQIERARSICSKADCVVGVSMVCKKIADSIGSGVKTLCIYNGFRSENVVNCEKLPHSIIQVGYLRAPKHADITVRAVAELSADYPDLTLTIVGSGTEEEALRELCRKLGIGKRVVFTGFLPNNEALKKMAESEVFVLPSTEEGFGIVYLEAMASGCVTVGTEGEGIDGVIVNGVNGFLVKPNDVKSVVGVVSYCFEHKNEAAVIAGKGKTTAEELTWEKNADNYLSLFKTLTEE